MLIMGIAVSSITYVFKNVIVGTNNPSIWKQVLQNQQKKVHIYCTEGNLNALLI